MNPSDKISQIELSEDFFKTQREAKIKEMIKDNAQKIAKQFNIDNCTITVTFND